MADPARPLFHIRENHASHLAQLVDGAAPPASSLELVHLRGEALASCLDSLVRLKPQRLFIRDGALTETEIASLARSGACDELETLVLDVQLAAGDSPEGDAWLPALLGSLGGRLKRLGLSDLHLEDADLAAIARAETLSSLEHLSILWNDPPVGYGLCALFESAALPRLRKLALACCQVHPDAMPALLSSPLAARMTQLSLRNTAAGKRFWAALPGTAALPELRRLNVDESDFGDEEALALSRARHLRQLAELDLCFSPLRAESALALLRAEGLPNLRLLADIEDWNESHRETFRAFGERFFLGRPHDCGTPEWVSDDHFWMDRW